MLFEIGYGQIFNKIFLQKGSRWMHVNFLVLKMFPKYAE